MHRHTRKVWKMAAFMDVTRSFFFPRDVMEVIASMALGVRPENLYAPPNFRWISSQGGDTKGCVLMQEDDDLAGGVDRVVSGLVTPSVVDLNELGNVVQRTEVVVVRDFNRIARRRHLPSWLRLMNARLWNWPSEGVEGGATEEKWLEHTLGVGMVCGTVHTIRMRDRLEHTSHWQRNIDAVVTKALHEDIRTLTQNYAKRTPVMEVLAQATCLAKDRAWDILRGLRMGVGPNGEEVVSGNAATEAEAVVVAAIASRRVKKRARGGEGGEGWQDKVRCESAWARSSKRKRVEVEEARREGAALVKCLFC